MKRKDFQKFLDRDKHCPHCGTTDDTLIPQHRSNRGMGGHKAGNQPANILVLCSLANGLIESDAKEAETARRFGWKIGRYMDPAAHPYYDATTGVWWQPDNFFGRERAIWQ